MYSKKAMYDGLYEYNGINNQYELVNTQLNTISEDIYGNRIVYTNIGKITGTLQNIDNLDLNQLNTRIKLYNDLSYLELNENITNMYCMFASSNLANIPNFDTSNVIDMRAMFQMCYNLVDIPNFNTSNITNMVSMFAYCAALTNIPNFDTSNVTNMRSMFQMCHNLVDIPNFNTSNVTSMAVMFQGCNNLTDIPQFNTSNVIGMINMFAYCNNLSNASIQNIVNMCLNSNITNSTLMNLNNTNGYSPLYATKFDNTYYQNRWSELTAAGWTY